MTHPHRTFARLRRTSAVVTVGLVGLALSTLVASPAAAEAPVGYVRLAHLSPDTPKVDVYVSKAGDSVDKAQVFQHVGYGVMSKYLALPEGAYAVAMRGEGASPSSNPVLTTEVTVQAGGAYTVAGVGKNAALGLRVLTDDLSRPADGKAKVRVIQASLNANPLDVSLTDGTPIAQAVSFASTTPYQVVDPGAWTLRLKPSVSSATTTLSVNLSGGSVYSLLVLDVLDGSKALKLELRADARGGSLVPDGGIDTGEGGSTHAFPITVIGVGLAVLVVLLVVALRLRGLASRRP